MQEPTEKIPLQNTRLFLKVHMYNCGYSSPFPVQCMMCVQRAERGKEFSVVCASMWPLRDQLYRWNTIPQGAHWPRPGCYGRTAQPECDHWEVSCIGETPHHKEHTDQGQVAMAGLPNQRCHITSASKVKHHMVWGRVEFLFPPGGRKRLYRGFQNFPSCVWPHRSKVQWSWIWLFYSSVNQASVELQLMFTHLNNFADSFARYCNLDSLQSLKQEGEKYHNSLY